MANKNHELDKPIIEAAKIEFLKNGFQSTSINSIAKRAGVTTGAIYTEAYMKYCIDKDFDNLLSSIEKETARYIDILFEYYYECKLLLCCSKGSSVESMFDEMMKNKIHETQIFIEKYIDSDISKLKLDLVELLMNEQFNVYALIIEKGYSKDETVEYIKMLGEFIGAGWEKIFKDFIK